jgi:hypothetical protein
MQDKSSNPLGLAPSTWIAVVIAAMGIFALKQYPFQDPRPPDLWVPEYSHTATEDQDVEARLWQDPLGAVETARKVDDAQAALAQDKNSGEPLETSVCSKVLAESAALKLSLQRVNGVHSARHLCESIAKKPLEASSVLMIGAIVSGAPYAADIETRRRARYAVLAGLYRSGYMPLNNQHVGYVHLAEFYKDPTRANDLAAFEWFVSEIEADPQRPLRPSYVLLLWLDQDGFRANPIQQFSTIADGILPPNVRAIILGPADSDGLHAIAEEHHGKGVSSIGALREVYIYSPWATATDDAIVRGIGANTELPRVMQFKGAVVHLNRTITSDSAVAKEVLEELHDRNIQPGEVALITERDTLYGRSMGQYFESKDAKSGQALRGCANPPREDPSSYNAQLQSLPLCISYLKGLDGVGPPPPKQSTGSSATAGTNRASSQPARADASPDSSTGPRQLDYLRRMGAALLAMQGAPDAACQSSGAHDCKPRYIKAIGVLGTDIYDKLLVLQELRPMFPDVVFFTFGLDSRYTDAENLPWTRQLLVGSSVGLSLRANLQADIPAFRDSYQATTFYSTLLALHRASQTSPKPDDRPLPADAGLQWTKQAKVFEIGRTQAIDLNIHKGFDDACQFDDACPSISITRTASFRQAVTRTAVSSIILLVPAFLWILLRAALGRDIMHMRIAFLPVSLTGVIVLLALLAVVAVRLQSPWDAVLGYLTRGNRFMPVPIADGASHWGKVLLEACIIPLVIALLIRGQRKLTNNAEAIRSRFEFDRKHDWLIEQYEITLKKLSWTDRAREWIYFPIGHLSNDHDKLPSLPDTSPLESLIARYLYRGVWQRRWARVLAATATFILVLRFLEWLGFSVFSGVPWALTEARKSGLDGWIAFFCFTFVQILIFWVIDAILLTRAFLLDVARDGPQWPEATLKKAHALLGLSGDLAPVLLNLRLIARRTSWVSGFIWYPSLVIAGMFAATFTFEFGQYHFDNNPVTLVASIVLIVGAVVALRRSAESWRSDVLQRLEHRRLALLTTKPPVPGTSEQLQVLVNLVTGLHDGAFAPYSEQPLVRAVLLPAVTFAATAGIPYLHMG